LEDESPTASGFNAQVTLMLAAALSLALAKSLAAQPACCAVKRQIRGGLAQRVGALASSGQD